MICYFALPEYNILFRWMSYFDLGTQSWVSAPPRTLVSFSQSASPLANLEEGWSKASESEILTKL